MRTPVIWVLLVDSARARVVRKPENLHGTQQIPLETVFELGANPRPLRDIMADRPGRSFASTGARRSAMAYRSDPVRDDTRRFAGSVMAALESRFQRREFDQLVISAPPRMLNILRGLVPDALAAAVRSEVAKDLTKLPELELRQRILELAGVPE